MKLDEYAVVLQSYLCVFTDISVSRDSPTKMSIKCSANNDSLKAKDLKFKLDNVNLNINTTALRYHDDSSVEVVLTDVSDPLAMHNLSCHHDELLVGWVLAELPSESSDALCIPHNRYMFVSIFA
jgi:hypothetical protein